MRAIPFRPLLHATGYITNPVVCKTKAAQKQKRLS
jgi:hypothetical protein